MKIIDVSEHQGVIDWSKVKEDGVEGAIIRAGYGKGNLDEQLYNNLDGAVANGLNIGIYWFSYAYTEDMAIKEAEYCHKAIVKYKKHINLPVFFDWEYDSMDYANRQGVEPSKQLITDMNRVFCVNIQSKGYVAGYYVNYDYSKNHVDCSQLEEWKKWYAQYTKKQQKNNYIWQYTSSGQVAGIDGNVDLNTLWTNISTETEKPVNEASEKSTEELAKEVIEGKYGNGEDREKALGDRYEEVQKLVNEILNLKSKSVDELAQEVLEGKYGNGKDREKALGDRYEEVQNRVNEIIQNGGYINGKEYSVLPEVGLNIRAGAGKDNPIRGVLSKGTKVTPSNIIKNGDDIWLYIERGWICARQGEKVFIQ